MRRLFAPTNKDGYKFGHMFQYPDECSLVAANFTPRGSRTGIKKVVIWGHRFTFQEYLIDYWNETFFSKPWASVRKRFVRSLTCYLGESDKNEKAADALENVHKLGYLPIEIWGLPEGESVDIRVPMFTIFNSRPDIMPDAMFAWVTNDLETIISCSMWLGCTSATTALEYRKLHNFWASITAPEMKWFTAYQGHDFSFRGMPGLEAACMSGSGALLSSRGTDTYPAIDFIEEYYGGNIETDDIGVSIPATEHAVMCVGIGQSSEEETFRRIIEDVYPSGPISIVSDTKDFWAVVRPDEGGILFRLKDKIMARKGGPVVIRPDSGDPVEIMCGIEAVDYTRRVNLIDHLGSAAGEDIVERVRRETDHGEQGEWNPSAIVKWGDDHYRVTIDINWDRHDKQYYYMDGWKVKSVEKIELTPEQKGLVQCLMETFGHTMSSTGYKLFNPCIGAIYGDSITYARDKAICTRLAAKGIASVTAVFGIGSFSFQGAFCPNSIITRDTYGMAMKSTACELQNTITGGFDLVEISKDPKTDDGLKKSAKGLTAVYKKDDGSGYYLVDGATWEQVFNCAFVQLFKDSKMVNEQSFVDARARVELRYDEAPL